MIWLAAAGLVVLLVVFAWAIEAKRTPEIGPDETARAAVELHAIRRRMDVAQMRSDLKREAIKTRRELAEELRDVN